MWGPYYFFLIVTIRNLLFGVSMLGPLIFGNLSSLDAEDLASNLSGHLAKDPDGTASLAVRGQLGYLSCP